MVRWLMGVLIVLVSAQLVAASPLSLELQKKYGAIKTFRATFEQELLHKESGMKENRKGKLDFAKPLKIRWETTEPAASRELLIVGSREIWNYLPEEAVAYRMPLELVQDSRSIVQVITGQAKLDKDFDVKPQGSENGLAKIVLYPKEPQPQMVDATIWVDEKTSLIRRAKITDFYGNTNDITMTSIVPDTPVPDSSFSFTPPAGVDVEDRMDPEVQERPLLN